MTIPFIHTTAAGLYLTDAHVVWVVGTRLGRHLRRLTGDSEPVVEGDVRAALRRLVERVRPGRAQVVTHLSPLHLRHTVLQGPAFDDAASFNAWLEAETARHLPPRADQADFVLRVQLLEQTEDYTRCLLALASRKAVEERIALLKEAGLKPVRIGTVDGAMGEALALDPGLAERRPAMLFVRAADTTLLQVQDGVLQALTTLPYGIETTHVEALLQEMTADLTPTPDGLFVAGLEARRVADQARDMRLIEGGIKEVSLAFLPQAASLLPLHVPAAALTLQHLFPVPDALNFLEPEQVETRRQENEKREAVRAILAMGGVIGVLFLVVLVITGYFAGKQADADAELLVLADQVERIEHAREVVKQLEQDIIQAERLVVERTHVARVLEGVGCVVSEALWLDAATLETAPSGALHLTLTGAAFSKSDVAVYLDSLEQTPFTRNVRLLFSESIGSAALYRQVKVQDRAVTRFEIELELTPHSQDVEASP